MCGVVRRGLCGAHLNHEKVLGEEVVVLGHLAEVAA